MTCTMADFFRNLRLSFLVIIIFCKTHKNEKLSLKKYFLKLQNGLSVGITNSSG